MINFIGKQNETVVDEIANVTGSVVEPYYTCWGKLPPNKKSYKFLGIIENTSMRKFNLIAGANLQKGGVVVDQLVATENHLRIGDKVTLNATYSEANFTVLGITSELLQGVCYFVLSDLQKIGREGLISGVYLRGGEVMNATTLPYVSEVNVKSRIRAELDAFISRLFPFIYIFLIFSIIIGSIIVFNTVTINLLEREHEFGLFQLIGARRIFLTSILILETIVLGLPAILLGILLGYICAIYLIAKFSTTLFKFSLFIPYEYYILFIIVGIMIIIIATLPALYKLRKLKLDVIAKRVEL
jgi:putative ABC transport system permease protein